MGIGKSKVEEEVRDRAYGPEVIACTTDTIVAGRRTSGVFAKREYRGLGNQDDRLHMQSVQFDQNVVLLVGGRL